MFEKKSIDQKFSTIILSIEHIVIMVTTSYSIAEIFRIEKGHLQQNFLI